MAQTAPHLLPKNETGIRGLQRPEDGERCYWHPEISGLHIRFRPQGRPTWRLQTRISGQTKKLTLGAWPAITLGAAEKAARIHLGKIASGADPIAERKAARKRSITLGELIPKFLEHSEKHLSPRSFQERRYAFRLLDFLHNTELSQLDVQTVANALQRIQNKAATAKHSRGGAAAASKAKEALSTITRWAASKGLASSSIHFDVRLAAKPPLRSRDRVLTAMEIKLIWESVDPETPFGRIIRIALLTACRRGAIGALQFKYIEKDRIVFPATIMKMRRQFIVPLTPAVSALLPQQGLPEEFVFGEDGEAPFQAWSKSKARLEKRVAEKIRGFGLDPEQWQIHDFRRTFATWMNDEAAAPEDVIDACLAHKRRGVGGVYDRAERINQRLLALEAWEKILTEKIGRDEEGIA